MVGYVEPYRAAQRSERQSSSHIVVSCTASSVSERELSLRVGRPLPLLRVFLVFVNEMFALL